MIAVGLGGRSVLGLKYSGIIDGQADRELHIGDGFEEIVDDACVGSDLESVARWR